MGNSLESAMGLALGRTASRSPSRLEDEVVALYDELRRPLLRYLLSLSVPAADGDEIVQEVFLALFRHMREGRDRSNLRGWIFRVGHNLALKNYQSRTRRPEAFPETAERWSDPAPDPEAQAAGNQRRQRLLSVVRALPEQDRACLSLRAEGFRYREIAKILGISLGSVSNSLERSLGRMKRMEETRA